jgi:methionyl aminopeptidase
MIHCRTPAEIEKIQRSGRLVREILEELGPRVQPGINALELERIAELRIKKNRAKPAFKGYRGYPNCLCVSINEQIVHGIPTSRRFQEGDIVSLDLGVVLEGYYGDSAVTVGVGDIPDPIRNLLRVTEEALGHAIEKVHVGNHLGDVSWAIQEHAEKHDFAVVREFVGHGIGTELHEEPQIPNFGKPGRGPRLKEGMVLAIEPMINQGTGEVRILPDQWTAVTADGSYSAHFEHMVAVTRNGPKILTSLNPS